MNDLRAMFWLTGSVTRRLLREPQVVRSLLWPIAIGPVVLVLTVLVWVWIEGDWPIAIDPNTPTEVVEILQAERWTLIEVPSARDAVAAGRYNLGTDGHTVFASADRGRTLELERVLRQHAKAPWMAGKPSPPKYDPRQGAKLLGVMGFQFVLFGVVFGAGMVARDRDDGTLEAELALGVQRWVHGASRWIAATAVLTLHFALLCVVIDAMMGIEDLGARLRHGMAACGASVAIGLFVIGQGGLKSGFSGPLAAGITLATGMASIGLAQMPGSNHIPIASLLAGGQAWGTLLVSFCMGLIAIGLFTWRSAHA